MSSPAPVTVEQLLSIVSADGGDVGAISLGRGNPEDRYCIVQDGDGWHVFYAERGQRYEQQAFSTEHAACAYLWQLLSNDETVWRQR